MKPNEPQSNNVIKGGYFNVSTKPAEPIVDSINNWGTISATKSPTNQQTSTPQPQSNQPKPASST